MIHCSHSTISSGYNSLTCWVLLFGDLNEHEEAYLYLSDECPLQDHFPRKPMVLTQQAVSRETWMNIKRLPQCHWLEALSLSRVTWMNMLRLPCIINEFPLQDHLPSNTIMLTQWVQFPETPEQMCRGFPSVNNKWPFQDHLSGTSLLTHRALSPSRCCLLRYVNECPEASLSQ